MRRFLWLMVAAVMMTAGVLGTYRARSTQTTTTVPIGVTQESIASAALSGNTVTGGSASGTTVGTINPVLTPVASFNGSVALSTTQGGCTSANGADNAKFQITGGTTLATFIAGIAGGSYAVCYAVTQTGANNSPFGTPVTVTASQTIASIQLSNNSVPSGSSGLTVGTASTTMSPTSPAFSGSFSVANGSGCANSSGTNFAFSGGTLQTNAALTVGTYCPAIVATQG